ncbi:MAG TPA: hypothetical protein VFH03_11900 [Actinoplanes sp.]|nr:hypothetical protein [Actinoplanes sp.]
MTRTRMTRSLITLALAGSLGLTACGGAPAAVDLAAEVSALQAVGLEAEPAPAASDAPGKAGRPALRKHLRKNTLHGEVTVQGKEGVRTIVVQRGTVTAVDAARVSVRSSDGYALTWTIGDRMRVVQNKRRTELSAVKTGAEIGVAGTKNGAEVTARLIVLK